MPLSVAQVFLPLVSQVSKPARRAIRRATVVTGPGSADLKVFETADKNVCATACGWRGPKAARRTAYLMIGIRNLVPTGMRLGSLMLGFDLSTCVSRTFKPWLWLYSEMTTLRMSPSFIVYS